MKILIVEDEISLAEALERIMQQAKYQVDLAYEGELGLELALQGDYDVIILDVMLPKKDGFSIVKELRTMKNNTPVLILTARDALGDKVKGLDKGADDYMTKPFEPEELLARVRALSRRRGELIAEEITYEDLILNISTAEIISASKSIKLSFKEFEIMKILISNTNMIISKELLIGRVWGDDSDAEDGNVEAYISFLRKKLKFIGTKLSIITVRKLGYRLGISQ